MSAASAAAAAANEGPATPMDIDDDDLSMSDSVTSSIPPSSPSTQVPTGAAKSSEGVANGLNGTAAKPLEVDDDSSSEEDEAPLPPPHRVTSMGSAQGHQQQQATPPPQLSVPPIDPELFKDAGNQHFSAREYSKAIQEYTKGRLKCVIPYSLSE